MTDKKYITPETKVDDLLDNYPQLENKLIEIAPAFKKLKNPVLRKTIAKVTSLKQVSVVSGVDIATIINELRKAAGQDEVLINSEAESGKQRPDWIVEDNITAEYDARIDLETGKHPVGKVTKEIAELEVDKMYVFITPFVPAPLIDIIQEKGFLTFTEQSAENEFRTYIKKDK